ncbi:MAG TPA: hypothetical protein PK324_16040, partial [Nocardioides sp.]|nr:hypothetical protein [Nocardioides sp.]
VTFSHPGSAPITTYTDASGTATAVFTLAKPGANPISAQVTGIPESRLIVRSPVKRRASAVAVAGRSRSWSGTTTVTALAPQTVTVANAADALMVGQVMGGSYTVTGGADLRTLSFRTYGPFDDGATSCNSAPAYALDAPVDRAGTWWLPAWVPGRSGYYRYGVSVSGNSSSTPAATCGANVRVLTQAGVGQYRPDGVTKTVKLGEPFAVGARVVGFDRGESHTVTSQLFGPFGEEDMVSCEVKHNPERDQTRNITGDGDYTMGSTVINAKVNVGWYVWQTTLSSGDLVLGGVSGCRGITVHVVK